MRIAEITVVPLRLPSRGNTQSMSKQEQHLHPDNKARRRRKSKPLPFNEPKPDNLS